MKVLQFHAIIMVTVAVAACGEINNQNEVLDNRSLSVTIGADHISAVSAVFNGKVYLGNTVSQALIVGFQYSTSADILPSNSITIKVGEADANNNYSDMVTGLEPATKYYFRSFVRVNGQNAYGETKMFTTKTMASMFATKDATEVDAISARLNAMLDLTDVLYNKVDYGFYWGTSESSQDRVIHSTKAKDMSFSVSLENLSHMTQYWYKAFLTLDDQIFYGEVKSFTTGIVPVTDVSLNKASLSLLVGADETLIATISPSNATNKAVMWSSSNTDVATVSSSGVVTPRAAGTTTIKVTTNDSSKTASCSVTVEPGTANGHYWVDLGLHSGLKWATCNVGANQPEEYGDYFAWGETKPKSRYIWSTYEWCKGTEISQTKYCTNSSFGRVDNKATLELADDAARSNWGYTWRIPTDSDWAELIAECTWTWTTQGGKRGYTVTSKSNGNSIFLPAAGDRRDSYRYNTGNIGSYWSSSLNMFYQYYACSVYFISDKVCTYSDYRYYGLCIRPVTE